MSRPVTAYATTGWIVLAFIFAFATPRGVRAYIDARGFTQPAIEGGGGGRLFTGAPADGYSCAVCHRGGAPIAASIAGIPPDGWLPSQRYDFTIEFPSEPRNVSAVIEVADERGRGLGTLEPLPESALTAADRCRNGVGAVGPVAVEGRTVARAEPCGARRARVRWTAPAAPTGSARIFAVVVAGDGSGDPTGDFAVRLVEPLRAFGEPPLENGALRAGCAATPERCSPASWLALVGATLALLRTRARATRPRRAASLVTAARSPRASTQGANSETPRSVDR